MHEDILVLLLTAKDHGIKSHAWRGLPRSYELKSVETKPKQKFIQLSFKGLDITWPRLLVSLIFINNHFTGGNPCILQSLLQYISNGWLDNDMQRQVGEVWTLGAW